MNYIQKLLKLNGLAYETGQFIRIKPHHIMTHDNSSAVMSKFAKLSDTIRDPAQLVLTIDHDIQNPNQAAKYEKIGEFAKRNGLNFFPPHSGIGHQIMVEQGFAFPNTIVVASDSHSNMYGGVGCLGRL